MDMCSGTVITSCCVVSSAVALHIEPELPRVSPQNSQISICSTEMWGSLGQLTGDKNTECGAVIKPLPPCSLSFDMCLLSPPTHCRVPLWPLLSSLLSTPTLLVPF